MTREKVQEIAGACDACGREKCGCEACGYCSSGNDRCGKCAIVRCACGEATGTECEWTGPVSGTVVIDYIPGWLRGSHDVAGNSGSYPQNGALRLRVEKSCAVLLSREAGE